MMGRSFTICTAHHILYYEGDQMEEDEMGGACGTCGGEEKCVYHFGGKSDGMRPLLRPGQRWEDNI